MDLTLDLGTVYMHELNLFPPTVNHNSWKTVFSIIVLYYDVIKVNLLQAKCHRLYWKGERD